MDPDFLDSDSEDDVPLQAMLQHLGMSTHPLPRFEARDEDSMLEALDVSAEMRSLYADLYKSVIMASDDDYIFLEQNKNFLNDFIFINCRRGCSHIQTFEFHQFFIGDTDQNPMVPIQNLEAIQGWIRAGKCCCTQNVSMAARLCTKTLMHVACSAGKTKMIAFLSGHGCQLDLQTTVNHYTPLFLAVIHDHIDAVRLLLEMKVTVNIRSRTELISPLMEAMMSKQTEIFKLLLTAPGVDLDAVNFRSESALIVATRMESADYVDALMKAGARPDMTDVRGTTALMHASRLGFVDITKLLLKWKARVDVGDARGDTALQFAVYREEVDLVEILLRAGADANHIPADGFPTLVVAAYNDSWEILELLLNHHADIAGPNPQGYTALHIAAWNGQEKSVELLLERGAPCDQLTADLNTPLSLAAHGRHADIIQLLLSHGCNVNNSDKDQDTPLHYASYNADVDAVTMLIRHGADPNARNRVDVTPLWNAVHCGCLQIVKVLLSKNVDLEVRSVGIHQHNQSDRVQFIYQTPRSPLWVAAVRNFPEVAMLLITAGYDISVDDWILTEELNQVVEESLRSLLYYHKTNPYRLVKICRSFLRQHFGTRINATAETLEIPVVLKNYIQLKDLTGDV